MLLAVAGTACLAMVVGTSVRAARRTLRYESWHLLHLYGYLGVGLALPHQLWTGQEFLTSPASTLFWWGLWIAAAAAILVWRLGVPLWRSARHRIRVTSVVAEGPDAVSVHLTGRRLDRLRVGAGRFFTSLSAARTAAACGSPPRTSATAARTCAGCARHAGAGGGAVRPAQRPRAHPQAAQPLFRGELEVIARERGLQVLWLPGHRRAEGSWLGAGMGAGDDATALTSWVPDIADRDVYVCGPEPWVEDVRRSARAAGVPDGRFHVESFGW
jgi:predicted ferric reductase